MGQNDQLKYHQYITDDFARDNTWTSTGRIRFKYWDDASIHYRPQYETRNRNGHVRWFDFEILPHDFPDQEV